MLIDRKTIAIVAVCLAVGWWLGSSPSSPINPTPQRPVLAAVGRLARIAARLGLWVAMAAETPPQADGRQLVHAPAVDADGHRVVDHGEGW
jgi:alkanesulfonate monooxygenase SsuD/methylene tetrahydromethanopterin reductase-like flavin-dependent oxidoreductase (luciferase family)